MIYFCLCVLVLVNIILTAKLFKVYSGFENSIDTAFQELIYVKNRFSDFIEDFNATKSKLFSNDDNFVECFSILDHDFTEFLNEYHYDMNFIKNSSSDNEKKVLVYKGQKNE